MRRFALFILLLATCLAICGWFVCCSQASRPAQGGGESVHGEAVSQDKMPTATDGQGGSDDAQEEEPAAEQPEGLLASPADIALVPADDTGNNYTFSYDAREFYAYYEPDVWKVYDSYLITNHHDIVMICQALLDEHLICGSDYQTARTAEDMAFEWEQHNIACKLLPPDSPWQESVRNVDLDPEDQNKTMREIYNSRMGEASVQEGSSEPGATASSPSE